MKAFKLLIISAAAMTMALFAAPASAQGEHHRNIDPKEMAVRRADRMRKALMLDEKTYKKVLKWCEDDAEYWRAVMEEKGFGPGEHQGGEHHAVPGREHRGGPGMQQGHGPRNFGGMQMDPEDKAFMERQDAKLRKILGPADYEKWKNLSHAAGRIRSSQIIK